MIKEREQRAADREKREEEREKRAIEREEREAAAAADAETRRVAKARRAATGAVAPAVALRVPRCPPPQAPEPAWLPPRATIPTVVLAAPSVGREGGMSTGRRARGI